jgi:hypothetical protein
VSSAFYLTSCTTGKYLVLKTAGVSFDASAIIVIEEAKVATPAEQLLEQIPIELQLVIQEELLKRNLNVSVDADGNGKAALRLRPTITHFEPGSAIEAHIAIGMGPGKARLVVQLEFIDESKQEVVAVIECTGYKRGRVYGGLGDQLVMARKVARQVAHYVHEELLTPYAKSFRK